jgi:hypothetical protein
MKTLRQGGGLSGFTKRAESEYDAFGAAHAATSISAALGFCAARNAKGDNNKVFAYLAPLKRYRINPRAAKTPSETPTSADTIANWRLNTNPFTKV